MIRINLLGGERQVKKKALAFDLGQRLTLACSLILVLTVAGVAYWYWSLQQRSAQLDADIARAQQEQARLQSIIREVNEFDQQRAALQQRVQLIEQLRSGQSIPVQLLDHVSRSLPDMLWLTAMNQEGDAVTIEVRSTTLIALSDFVGNLGSTPLLSKPIEIVNSQVETNSGASTKGSAPLETIKFTVRAQLAGGAPKDAKDAKGAKGAAAGRK